MKKKVRVFVCVCVDGEGKRAEECTQEWRSLRGDAKEETHETAAYTPTGTDERRETLLGDTRDTTQQRHSPAGEKSHRTTSRVRDEIVRRVML